MSPQASYWSDVLFRRYWKFFLRLAWNCLTTLTLILGVLWGFDRLNSFFITETLKRHILGWIRVVWSIYRENPSTRFCWTRQEKERKGTQSHKRVIFQLYGEQTALDRFPRKLAGVEGVHDVIIRSHFGFSIFRGFRSTGGQNLHCPIDFAGHRYNSAAATAQPVITSRSAQLYSATLLCYS